MESCFKDLRSKKGPKKDHFSSLVLKRTKSLIKDLYASTEYEIFIYRPGLYLSVRQTMQEMEKSKWSSLAWRFDDFSFPCKFTTWNVAIQSLILRQSWCRSTLTMLSWQTRMVSFSSWVTETMFISSWRGTTVCVPSASSNSSLQIWVVRKQLIVENL